MPSSILPLIAHTLFSSSALVLPTNELELIRGECPDGLYEIMFKPRIAIRPGEGESQQRRFVSIIAQGKSLKKDELRTLDSAVGTANISKVEIMSCGDGSGEQLRFLIRTQSRRQGGPHPDDVLSLSVDQGQIRLER